MQKFFLFIVGIVVFFKYGVGYVLSDKFQSYADQTKAPWTCQVTLYIGQMYLLLDQPFLAQSYFDRIPSRCGGLPVASEASFQSARCFDQADRTAEAVSAYERFLVLHSTSARSGDAQKAINRMKGARSL